MTTMNDTPERMAARKNDHIRLCQNEAVESRQGEPFSKYLLAPATFPELNLSDVRTEQTFLGRPFAMPLLITGMTGGVDRGEQINDLLAHVAAEANIPMGLGSQKIMLKRPESSKLFDVKKRHPKVFLMGNIGVVSFHYGVTLDDLKFLVDSLQLDAFALHVNALQECVQPEGERNFSNLLAWVEKTVRALSVPVVVKEVGAGLDSKSFRHLVECGVKAVDVGGLGGTNWSAIEGMRGDAESSRLGELFRNWGIPTDQSLTSCVEVKKALQADVELIATGGMRHGIHVAKAVACGATMAGVGLPLLRAILNAQNETAALDALRAEISFFRRSLSVAMFCSGVSSLSLLSSRLLIKENSHA